MTFVGDDLVELIVEGVRTADLLARQADLPCGGMVLVFFGSGIGHVIRSQAVELVILLIERIDTAFHAQVEILDDMPGDGAVEGPVGTDTPLVVVGDTDKRRGVVAIILFHIGIGGRIRKRNRAVDDRMFETGVAAGGAARVIDGVGSRAVDLGVRITHIQVEGQLFDGLVLGLERKVVAVVVGPGHDSLLVDVRVVGRPFDLVGAAADHQVVAEGAARIAEELLDPVVAGDILIKVDVVEGTEEGNVALVHFVPDRREFVLGADELIRRHDLDGVLVGHPFAAVISVV